LTGLLDRVLAFINMSHADHYISLLMQESLESQLCTVWYQLEWYYDIHG
jgi:hypothetical protein